MKTTIEVTKSAVNNDFHISIITDDFSMNFTLHRQELEDLVTYGEQALQDDDLKGAKIGQPA